MFGSAELVQLMMKHQRRLFAYIYTLVPSRSDAEDILSRNKLNNLRKFKDFEIERTSTLGLAKSLIGKSKWKKFATSKVLFNQDVMDVIAQTRGQMEEELDSRHYALGKCLNKLNERDRRMVLTRYESGKNVASAAHACGRTVQGAYKALNRIRKVLFDCVSLN